MKTKIQNQTIKGRAKIDEPTLAGKNASEAAHENAGPTGKVATRECQCPKSMRLWLLFMAVALTLGPQGKAIEVFGQLGFSTFSVNNSGLTAGPNGTFFGPWDGGIVSENQGINLYTPIGAGTSEYGQFFIANPSCAGKTNPVVSIVVNPDGTITANTATGGGNNTGATYTVTKNGGLLCCADRPATEGTPTGDIGTAQFGGDFIDWMVETSGSSSNQTVEMEGFDFTPCPPEQVVDPPLPAGDYNPNGLTLYQGGTAPSSLSGYVLYGTTEYGGTNGSGILYSIKGDGTGFQVLHNFGSGANDGAYPRGNVIFSPDGSTLYGTASGPNGGVVYMVSTNGTGYTNLVRFNSLLTSGNNPVGDLLLIGNTFYGAAANGGNFMLNDYTSQSAAGVIFSVKTNGTDFNALYTFAPLFGLNTMTGLHTNTFGATPAGGLILSSNVLIGATTAGGTNGYGTIFGLPLIPPIITNQPANQALDFGDPVVIPAGVDGAGPFYYQWQHNGTNLTDAYATNNPYVIPNNGFNSPNQLGGYSVIITNAYGSVTSSVATLSLDILQNDSFEAGSLTGWTLSSDANASAGIANYRQPYVEGTPVSYSGSYGADLKNTTLNQMDSMSQAAPTIAGQSYLLSFWLNTSMLSSGYSNEFSVSWNGNVVLSLTNIPTGTNSLFGSGDPAAGWTNIQCAVSAPGTNSALAFGFQTGHSGDEFILDAVSLLPQLPQFTATPSVGAPPLAVQFGSPATDVNGNPLVGWDWNFGDGATSTAQDPSHTFNATGVYTPTLSATNSEGQTIAVPGPFIDVVFLPALLNGGFETGSLSPWTVSGNSAIYVFENFYPYIHSGSYSVVAFPNGSLGYLSQTCATTPGTQYLLSFWLYADSFVSANEFLASWNGTTLVNLTNVPYINWTNFQYTVTATSSSSVVEFGFRKDSGYFGFDDVSLTPLVTSPPSPIPLNVQLSGRQIILNWTNAAFSLQTAPTVTGTWMNVSGASTPYTNSTTNRQTYFRLAH